MGLSMEHGTIAKIVPMSIVPRWSVLAAAATLLEPSMGRLKRMMINAEEQARLATGNPIIEGEYHRWEGEGGAELPVVVKRATPEKKFVPKIGKVYFFHHRPYTQPEWGPRIPPTPYNPGGMTLALQYYHDDDGTPMVRFGIGQCSERDQFCKKIGRDISLGRMLKKPLTRIAIPEDHENVLANIILDYWGKS